MLTERRESRIAIIICSVLMGLYVGAFCSICRQLRDGGSEVFIKFGADDFLVSLLVAIGCFVALSLVVSRHFDFFRNFCFKYRYVITLTLLIVFVALNINGSSIAQWSKYIGGAPEQGTLLGLSRSVRGDEFMVFTPFAFSQAHTGYASVSEILRGTPTDVTMVYAQPCWSFATLFRPFLWGYLFFGSVRGLAFYWSARLFVLLLVSFEFGRILFDRSKWIAAAYAFMMCFSPVIQWWFSINGLVEMLIFGQGLVLCLHALMRSSSTPVTIVLTLLMAYLASGFILVAYPAWQVPVFWIFLAIGVGDIIAFFQAPRLESSKTSNLRRTVVSLFFALILTGLFVVACFVPVLDVVRAVSDTIYPGKRLSSGGGGLSYLMFSVSGYFNSLQSDSAAINACESVGFSPLFPLGLLSCMVYVYLNGKSRFSDTLSVLPLLAVELILTAYVVFGLPDWLAGITLLSHSTSLRISQMIGLADLVLLMRCGFAFWFGDDCARSRFDASFGVMPLRVRVPCLLALFIYILYVVLACLETRLRLFYIAFSLAVCALSLWAILSFNSKGEVFPCFCLSLVIAVSGACVNPIQRGASSLLDSEAYKGIEEVSASLDGALWAAESNYLGQLCVAAGAPCINSVNTYPDLERWHELDPSGLSADIYNRYAHISISLTDGDNSVFAQGASPDTFSVSLTLDDASRLGVRYFVSSQGVAPKGCEGRMELVRVAGPVYIWRLE